VSDLFDKLNLDPDRFVWQDLAACRGLDFNLFFDEYEEDPVHAKTIDSMCLHCPVIKSCHQEAIDNNETGVWGGIYFSNGTIDKSRNLHKTDEDWQELMLRIGFNEAV
jgi:hypothetical protein